MGQVQELLDHDIVKAQLDVMPIFQEYLISYKGEKPFSGLKIGFAHVLAPNTVVMIATLLNGGADLDIITNNGLTHNPEVIELLKEAGLNVLENHPDNENYDYVIDCGGYFTTHPPNMGAVEVTRTGIHKYLDLANPSYTLIDIDTTQTKLIETFIGNPEGVYLTLKHFLQDVDSFLRGSKIAVVGFGKIGRGTARKFRDVADILVVDISDTSLRKARSLGFKTYQVIDNPEVNSRNLADMDLIITATGHEGTMSKYFVKSELEGSLKINLGAEDEWGEAYDSSEIFHSKSKPFNFNLSPPTPSKYIDPILALHVDGLKFFVTEGSELDNSRHIIPKSYDNKILKRFNDIYQNEAKVINRYFTFK